MNEIANLFERLGLPAAMAVGLLWMIWRAGRALGATLLSRATAWFDTQIELGTTLVERNRTADVSTDRLQRGVDSIRLAGVEFCDLALSNNRCQQLGLDPTEVLHIRRQLIGNPPEPAAMLNALAEQATRGARQSS